jgi:Uma2 family endonuclease
MISSLHLTLAEYDEMVRRGAFDGIPRKVELIRGELTEMNPAGPIHDDLITYLTNWSARNADPAKTMVTSQTGLDLPEQQSRPEPDLMWLRTARYRDGHPQSSDVQLAIEVSHSSLAYDLETKRKLYAEANIIEYWIVDSRANCIHVNRDPSDGDYQTCLVRSPGDTLAPLAHESAILTLNDLFCING